MKVANDPPLSQRTTTIDTKFRGLKYAYDANGRQTAVKLLDDTSVQSSVYDCAGQRVQTTAGSSTRTMVYDIFGQDVAEYLGSSGSTLERENIYRGGQLLATNESLSGTAPTALATTPSSTNIALSWSGSAGNYRVERQSAGGSYGLLTTTTSTSTTDNTASSGSAYLYRVCAADGSGNCTSDYSNIALGARLNFTTDSTIVGYSDNPATATSIKAAHITELRTAINAVRSLAGQSSATWTHSGLAPGDLIYADDVRDLRARLNDALVALNIQTSNYTDNTIISYADDPLNATTVKAVHIRELRTRATSGSGTSGTGGSSGGLHYVLSDLQGSTRAVMNNNGSSSAVVARHDYLPFGEEIGSGIGLRSSSQSYSATDTNRWKYGMTERDSTTGLDHTWWRKYESFSGRWTSPDPLGGSISNPQTFNHYSYTQSDPVNFVDPSGLLKICFYAYSYTHYEYTAPDGTPGLGTTTNLSITCFEYGTLVLSGRGIGDGGDVPQNSGLYPNPPKLKGHPTQDQIDAFNDAYFDLRDRILNNSDCAKLFGGAERALRKLQTASISLYSRKPITIQGKQYINPARTVGRNSLQINTYGGLFAGDPNTSLSLGHELGHLLNIYGKDEYDATDPNKNSRNTEKVRKACF
jgi:RHS repeat-associated protein